MPSLNDRALTTLANTKTYLGVTSDAEDTLLTFLINSASSWIEGYCNRIFKKNAYTEYLRGNNNEHLFLSHYPIIGSVALYENVSGDATDDFETITSDRYWLLDDEGVLEANEWKFKKKPRAYKVVYEAGYKVQGATVTGTNEKLPDELELACWKLVAGIYNQRKAEGTSNQSLGGYSVQFNRLVEDDPSLKQTLINYRRVQL